MKYLQKFPQNLIIYKLNICNKIDDEEIFLKI